jgi:hypothetical protein
MGTSPSARKIPTAQIRAQSRQKYVAKKDNFKIQNAGGLMASIRVFSFFRYNKRTLSPVGSSSSYRAALVAGKGKFAPFFPYVVYLSSTGETCGEKCLKNPFFL